MTLTLEALLEARDIQPIEPLVALAGHPCAAGDDVRAAFVAQAELRQRACTTLLEGARGERADLLASDARTYDRHQREIDTILGLARQVEQRGAYRVPATQEPAAATLTASPVVGHRQSVRDWLRARGGSAYGADRGAEPRFGAIVRALALGDRRGLSALEARALSEGSDSSGGYTVPEIVAGQFIDRMRNAMIVMRAGAVTVPMTTDTLHLARLGQPDSVSPTLTGPTWKVENDPIAENDLALERVTFQARTLPMLIKLSVELSEDSANVDAVIEQEMAQAMAVELDRVALLGSGSAPEPRGIRHQSGVSVVSFGSVAPTNHDFLVDAIARVWARNHEPNARVTNAALAALVAKLKSSADDQPLRAPDVVTAVPAYRTQQMPSAGTSPDTTSLIVGDFTQLMIGLRTSFRLEVSRVAGDSFERLQVCVRAYLRADVQLAHPEAFDVTTDVGI